MKLPTLRRSRAQPELPGLTGTARVDRRTKNLTKRLRPGDIAVIDHVDLDRVSAEALVACAGRRRWSTPRRASAAATPTSARRSSSTPASRSSTRRHRASCAPIEDGELLRVARGRRLPSTTQRRSAKGDGADRRRPSPPRWTRPGPGSPSSSRRSPRNTMEYLRRERDLLLDGVGVPDIRTALDGRHVAHRGARLPLPRGPRHAAALHPRVPPGPDRRRRRRRRAARGRLHAGPDRRRHGLGLRRGAELRRRARRARLPRRPGARPGAGRSDLGLDGRRLPRDRHQRGRRDAARRRQGRRA